MAMPADNSLPCAGCRALNAELRRDKLDASREERKLRVRIYALEMAIDVALKNGTLDDLRAVRARKASP